LVSFANAKKNSFLNVYLYSRNQHFPEIMYCIN